jgi:hypothetical protein
VPSPTVGFSPLLSNSPSTLPDQKVTGMSPNFFFAVIVASQCRVRVSIGLFFSTSTVIWNMSVDCREAAVPNQNVVYVPSQSQVGVHESCVNFLGLF